MPSPLFSLLGGGNASPPPFQNIITKYKQSRAAFNGGNSREQVEQINQYQQMAQQIQNAMKGDAS